MRSSVCTLAALLFVSLAFAQTPEKGPKPTSEPAKPKPETESKDPTKASPDLRKVLDPGKAQQGVVVKLPNLALKGRVIVRGRPPAVLIEVDGKGPPLLVARDQVVTVGGAAFKVLEVTANEVRLQGGPYDEIIVLR